MERSQDSGATPPDSPPDAAVAGAAAPDAAAAGDAAAASQEDPSAAVTPSGGGAGGSAEISQFEVREDRFLQAALRVRVNAGFLPNCLFLPNAAEECTRGGHEPRCAYTQR